MEPDITRKLDEAAGPPALPPDIGAILAIGRRRRRSARGAAALFSVLLATVIGVSGDHVRDIVRDDRSPAAGGLALGTEAGGIVFGASENGDRESALYVMNPAGGDPKQILDEPVGGEMSPAWSPNGELVAFAMNVTPGEDPGSVDTNMEIFVVRSDGTGLRRMTDHPGLDTNPAWSPDGTRIAFTRWPDAAASEGGDAVAIWSMNRNGSGLERLTHGPGLSDQASWSPDGEHIAFSRYVSARDAYAVFITEAEAKEVRRPQAITHSPYGVTSTSPSWSPDGTRIAFVRDENQNRGGDSNIYVIDSDGSNPHRITGESGYYNDPTWSPDGKSIAFIRGNRIWEMPPDSRDPRPLGGGYESLGGIDWAR
jgi:Tol biopolymer transport system component